MQRAFIIAVASILVSCGYGMVFGGPLDDGGTGGGSAGGGAGGGGGGEPDAGPLDAGIGGLPCDVAALIEARCASCHRRPPVGGAPYALTQHADFTQPSPGHPGQTVADRCLLRVQQLAAPMPPTPNAAVTPAEVAVLAAWIDAGTPLGSCGEIDGGTGPFPTTCASGTYWARGNQESPAMNPGLACVSCHAQMEPEKAYFFMGTAYPAFHEKDLCDAPPPAGGQVEIIDANGNVALTLTPNGAGNFYSQSSSAGIALPYTARVLANGNSRAMATPQTNGDCNGCHTEQGTNAAPGRITWP